MNPRTNHPKSMFQLPGVHCKPYTLIPKPCTLNPKAPDSVIQSACAEFRVMASSKAGERCLLLLRVYGLGLDGSGDSGRVRPGIWSVGM